MANNRKQGSKLFKDGKPLGDDPLTERTWVTSAGYTVTYEPMPYVVYQGARLEAFRRFPDPPLPVEQVEGVGGQTIEFRPGEETLEFIAYRNECALMDARRLAFQVKFLVNYYLTVEGLEDEEARGAFVAEHRHTLKALEALGQTFETPEEEWAGVFSTAIAPGPMDQMRLKMLMGALFLPIGETEVAEAAEPFPGDVGRDADPAGETSGAEPAHGGESRSRVAECAGSESQRPDR